MRTLKRHWARCAAAAALGAALVLAGPGVMERVRCRVVFYNPADYAHAPAPTQQNTLLVNAQNPLPEDYRPKELIELFGARRTFEIASADIALESYVLEAANQLFARAAAQGVAGFVVTSGYRTREQQRALYESDGEGLAAPPGASEHETGLAMDVTARSGQTPFEDSVQYEFLIRNCWEFGFIPRYPDGAQEITGVPFEPWHFRYVGRAAALEMQRNHWTLEEYAQRRESHA